MLTLDQLKQIRTLLASDRLTVKGHEVVAVAMLLGAIQGEEVRLTNAARVREVSPETPNS